MVAGAATVMAASAATEASAVPIGEGVPEGQISIQLYSFNTVIGNTDQENRLKTVLAALKDAGYSAVEPHTFYGLSAAKVRELIEAADLRAVARHGSPAASEIPNSKVLGQEYVGS